MSFELVENNPSESSVSGKRFALYNTFSKFMSIILNHIFNFNDSKHFVISRYSRLSTVFTTFTHKINQFAIPRLPLTYEKHLIYINYIFVYMLVYVRCVS